MSCGRGLRAVAALLLAACAGAPAPGWRELDDGRTLAGWAVTDFGGQGTVELHDGAIVLGQGAPLTGITWQGDFPRADYELELLATRRLGSDFFCGLTFPVGDAHLSLVVGGWGGGLVGLSSLDGADAAHNATRRQLQFRSGQPYRIRIAVERDRVRAWIDELLVVDADLRGHQLGLRPEVLLSRPLGIASYATVAELRQLRWRPR